jgi:hypothetical protein
MGIDILKHDKESGTMGGVLFLEHQRIRGKGGRSCSVQKIVLVILQVCISLRGKNNMSRI